MKHLNYLIQKIISKIKKDAWNIEMEMGKKETKKYDSILDNPNNILWRRINTFIIILILFSIFCLVIETIWDNYTKYAKIFFIVDWFMSSIFAIEYLYRLYKSRSKKVFFTSRLHFIDLISFLPFFIKLFLPWTSYISFLETLRLFRIFKLLKYNRNIFYFLKSFKNYKYEFSMIWIIIFIILIFSWFVMYFIESRENTIWFENVANSIWWAIVTMATLWYGDVVPATALWKIFWSIVIILWPIMFAMLSSISILVFMEVAKAKDDEIEKKLASKEKTCKRCGYINPLDANYCMKCGKSYIQIIKIKK